MGLDRHWEEHGLCRTVEPDELFVEGAAQNRAKSICTGCPVLARCLAYALDQHIEHGVWGGMTERERRALLRRRPNVSSWRNLLEGARLHHERGAVAGLLETTRYRGLTDQVVSAEFAQVEYGDHDFVCGTPGR